MFLHPFHQNITQNSDDLSNFYVIFQWPILKRVHGLHNQLQTFNPLKSRLSAFISWNRFLIVALWFASEVGRDHKLQYINYVALRKPLWYTYLKLKRRHSVLLYKILNIPFSMSYAFSVTKHELYNFLFKYFSF